jgi:hypothetical protein
MEDLILRWRKPLKILGWVVLALFLVSLVVVYIT